MHICSQLRKVYMGGNTIYSMFVLYICEIILYIVNILLTKCIKYDIIYMKRKGNAEASVAGNNT
jgi:hypothetical protein